MRLLSLASKPLATPLAAAPRPRPLVAAASAPQQPHVRLDCMDTVLLHPWHDLDLAENELSSYCSLLGPDDAPERCWQAYSFLESKREAAKQGCDVADASACADLRRLNDLTHDLLATGSMDDLVATFSSLARVEQLREAHGGQQAPPAASQPAAEAAPADDAVAALFRRMDTNGDGLLSLWEFQQGLPLQGERLDGATVALIAESFALADGHRGIDLAQFRDILDAEQLNSHAQVATLWRHHLPARRRSA